MKRILGKDWNDHSSKAKRAHTHVPMPGTVDENVEETAGVDKEMAVATPSVDMYSPTVINTKFLRFVLTQIPQYITPMYQGTLIYLFVRRCHAEFCSCMDIHVCHLPYVLLVGITKMLFSRREMEPAQRTNAFKIADSLSGVLQSHISWTRLGKGLIRFLSPVP